MAVKEGSRQDCGSRMDTGMKGTDADLLAVQRTLDSDGDLSAYGLKVSSANELIQIIGIVDTLADKEKIKPLLANLGIAEFADGVSISADGHILDEEVAQEVLQEIESEPQLAGNAISVECVAGTVYLAGEVGNSRQEKEAQAAARRARGVVQVVSQLRCQSEE